eukprot:maker-scaffold1959_size23944-snap-gene-0.6 protein:Tk11218 transcript:maker-scaffold1959_size23944-snap-gene-0.6-mRNA-1 annotation:"wd repeat and hmg-box dna-binding protein 1"
MSSAAPRGSATLSAMRFAHTEGRSSLRYTPDGSTVVTCGSDGEVRLYQGIDDDDPISHLAGDETLAVAVTDERFFVAASGTNTIQGYSLAEGQSEGVITRFTADGTALAVSGDGRYLLAGSDDMTVKLVDTQTYKDHVFRGHEAPILSVALDPRESEPEFAVSSSCDGTVRIWNIAGENEIQCVDGLAKANDLSTAKSPGVVALHPKGKYLAIPMESSVVIYAQEDGWTKVWTRLSAPNPPKDEIMGVVAWAKDGDFLASATSTGRIFIWDFYDKSLAFETKTTRGYGICDLAWHPSKYELAIMDSQGYWGLIDKMTFVEDNEEQDVEEEEDVTKTTHDEGDLDADQLAALMEDDDDNENSFSIRKIKRDTGFLSEDDSNMSKPHFRGEDQERGVEPVDAPPTSGLLAPVLGGDPHYQVDIQPPFQPTATPTRLSSRFMAWNSVGVVKCFNNNEENSIEVEFHDTAIHHSFHITNAHNHSMADLSRSCLVLASEIAEDDPRASRITCRLLASSDLSPEWSIEMPPKEEVLAICCGRDWLAAATDRRLLRIFSSGGNQWEILALPGPILALAGHENWLMVTCHTGMALPGSPSVSFAVFDLRKSGRRHPAGSFTPLPFAPNTELVWIGFSDEGTPGMMDSAGQVRLLHSGFGACWTQICDTRSGLKTKSDHHFLVGISEQEHQVRTILCKGATYPGTTPPPTVALVPFALPLCEAATEKGVLEEELWKCNLLSRALRGSEPLAEVEETQSRCLIKLFALAMKNDHETRALEICKLMDAATIGLAIRYASSNRRMQLAQRISKLANDALQEEQEQQRAQSQMSHADMFEDQGGDEQAEEEEEDDTNAPSNPILEAKMKRNLLGSGGRSRTIIPDSQGDAGRNPFARKSVPNTPSGAIRKGDTVFDDMTLKSQSSRNRGSFGDRKFKPGTGIKVKPAFGKQSTIVLKKTVPAKDNGAQALSPLSGFQLWLAENRGQVAAICDSGTEDSAINIKGLEMWKQLKKEDKDQYRSPRVPKRKSEDELTASPASKLLKV